MHDIFLSYSRKDTDLMQRIKKDFKDAGLTIWTDEGIKPGTPSWTSAIENAIDTALVLVCISSPDAKKSRWVQAEINRAEMRKKTVYLILARGDELDSIPFGYNYHQYTDIRNRHNHGKAIARLIEQIKSDIGASPEKSAPSVGAQHVAPEKRPQPKPKLSPIQRAIELAQNFKGTRNSDWTPFIAKLGELEPNTPLPELEMCLVPVGSFMMGGENYSDERPIHLQTIIAPYWIACYPVTNAQWKKAVSAQIINQPQGDTALEWYNDSQKANWPVVGVTWFAALKFAQWIKCTLPTEPLWEFAARGIESLVYPWGTGMDTIDPPIFWDENTGRPDKGVLNPTWIGTMDMSDDIKEWVLSKFKAYPYVSDDEREENLTKTDVLRCLRGSAWFGSRNEGFRVAYRKGNVPDYYNLRAGLRISISIF